MRHFKQDSSIEIIEWIQSTLEREERLSFEVLSPDIGKFYSGALVEIDDELYIYRSLKSWMDLANALECRMLLPQISSEHTIILTFEKLKHSNSFHYDSDSTEKYGTQSNFFAIDKSSEFAFSHYYYQALKALNFDNVKRVINLGINRGDEFASIEELLSQEAFDTKEFVGIDYSKSAIEYAKNRFANNQNMHFYTHDIRALEELELGEFDLLVTVATLQSISSNFKKLFMHLVKELLSHNSAIIMGFPNSRWMDGELIYGAKVPHYNASELSTVIKDIYFCKKYLQQHKYRVQIIGKEYLFLVASKIGTRDN